MPNLEWEVAHDLITPGGTIPFNQTDPTTHRRYQIDGDGSYKIIPSLRVTTDNRSQADGSILHPRWKTGLVATLKVQYMIMDPAFPDFVWACEDDLRIMHEDLTRALDSIRRLSQNQQRFIWTPTGYVGGRRMLDFVQCLAWPDPGYVAPGSEVTFALETPFPYAIDFTQQSASLPATITNPGTSNYNPVLQVHGFTSAFTITNTSVLDEFGNPLAIVYDATLPGAQVINAGHYGEIDTYKGSIFLDGNSSDLTAGLDQGLTDFFPLAPGPNVITISGAPGGCTVLWNPAWS